MDSKARSAIQRRPGASSSACAPRRLQAVDGVPSVCTKAACKIYFDHSRRFNFSQSRSSLSVSRQLLLHLHHPVVPCVSTLPFPRPSSHKLQQGSFTLPRCGQPSPPSAPARKSRLLIECRAARRARSRPRLTSLSRQSVPGTYRRLPGPFAQSVTPATPCPVRRAAILGWPSPAALCDRARQSSLHSSPPTTKGRRSPALLVQPKRCRLLRFPHSSFSLTQVFPDSL